MPTAAVISVSLTSRQLLVGGSTSHTQHTIASSAMRMPPGALNPPCSPKAISRSAGTAAHVTAYVISRIIVLMVSDEMKLPWSVHTSIPTGDARIAT